MSDVTTGGTLDRSGTAAADRVRAYCRGPAPLTARLEPWMVQLAGDPAWCARLLADFGSPLNLLHAAEFARNGEELVDAGRRHGVPVRPFFARKANKALIFVDAARDAGFGLDVASYAELGQVLGRGVPGEDVVLTAAVKSDALLDRAVASGTVISVDNRTELAAVGAAAARVGTRAQVCPRLAVSPELVAPTRFGERSAVWLELLGTLVADHDVQGVHVHLDGYAAADRVAALGEVLPLVDALRAAGADIRFVDLGGGVPMSYLDSETQWHDFWAAHHAGLEEGAPLTWKGWELRTVYPYWQRPVRGTWVDHVLCGHVPGEGTVARALRSRGLELRLEPGRSLLDGCGLTLARVVFTKERSDGVPLVALEMNRTQCRSTSADFLVDPLLVPGPAHGHGGPPLQGYLVGAYCIEDELILARRLVFPDGVAPGDAVLLPNTAGYLMHIVESASHQLPLARNVVLDDAGAARLDPIDVH